VLGPKDVGINGFEAVLTGVLKAPDVIRPPGGNTTVDVRDLATAIARLLKPGGPRRYVAGGNFVTWEQTVSELLTAAGDFRPIRELTEQEMTAMYGRAVTQYYVGQKPGDDAPLQRDTGVTWRPFAETMADFVEWMNSRDAVRRAGS
jgi:nucleoside-diphosphate-sugar epimerase